MSRPKIKSKVVRGTLANKDVLDMFHGVLGTSSGGGAALSVTYPKYLRIRTHVERFLKLLAVLRDSQLLRLFPAPQEGLARYVEALQGQFAASFAAPDFGPHLPRSDVPGAPPPPATAGDYDGVPVELVEAFNATFAAVKECSLVNTVVVTCNNLTDYKKSLQDQGALKDRFLLGVGLTVSPLPDLPLNFKQIYIDDRLTSDDKKFVLVVLHKLYTIGHDVYEAVTSPDVDVGEFVEVIMSSIEEVKKHIPRCDQAFAKIVESVELLKGNFSGYYKDYVASSNPTIIMENFVIDVSKNTQSSPRVTAQFQKIITHYRRLAGQQAAHPKLQSLFQQVDKNFKELETKSRVADAASTSSDDDADAGVAAADAAAVAAADAGVAAADAAAVAAADAAVAATDAARAGTKAARNRRKKARARARTAQKKAADAAGGESLAEEFGRAEQEGADEGAAAGEGPAADGEGPAADGEGPAADERPAAGEGPAGGGPSGA